MISESSGWARPIRRASVPFAILVAIVVLGCSSPTPQPSTSPPPVASPSAGPASPSAVPASPAPSPTNGSSEDGPAVACIGVDESDCQGYADQILAAVIPVRGPPFAMLIWSDQAFIEFATGGPPERVTLTTPDAPAIPAGSTMFLGPYEPTSTRVVGQGPFPFEVGHCGLTWRVDFDGSFWLPFGQVDGDSDAILGADNGQIVLVAPDHARYSGADGAVVNLIRFPGPKHAFGCR